MLLFDHAYFGAAREADNSGGCGSSRVRIIKGVVELGCRVMLSLSLEFHHRVPTNGRLSHRRVALADSSLSAN